MSYTTGFIISAYSTCTNIHSFMEYSLKKPLANIYSQFVDECVVQYGIKKLSLVQIDSINCFLA